MRYFLMLFLIAFLKQQKFVLNFLSARPLQCFSQHYFISLVPEFSALKFDTNN
jgi:hypothetical protein